MRVLGNAFSQCYAQVAKSRSIVLLARITSQAITCLTAIMLARLLGASGYGIYALALAILSLLGILATVGLPGYLVREVAVARADGHFGRLRHLISRSLGLSVAASLVCAGAASALLFVYFNVADPRFATTLVAILALVPLVLASIFISTLSGLGHPATGFAIETLVRPVCMLCAACTIYLWRPSFASPMVIIWVQVGSSIVLCGLAFLLLLRTLPAEAMTAETDEASSRDRPLIIWSALPFLALSGVAFVNNQTDILMLGALCTPEDVGVYRVAVQLSVLVTFGLNALNVVLAPQIAHAYALGDKEKVRYDVARSARLSFLVGMLPALLLFVYGGVIAAFIFGPEFARAAAPIGILVFGQMINVAMGPVTYVLTMTGRERTAMHVMTGSALLNVVLNAALIPVYGITGAAIATAVSLCAWNLVLARIVWKDVGIKPVMLGPWPTALKVVATLRKSNCLSLRNSSRMIEQSTKEMRN